MKKMKTQDLTPGMITAQPALTKHNQVIVDANTALTEQIIAHLEFYNIPEITILTEDNSPKAQESLERLNSVQQSRSKKIQSSDDFKKFTEIYTKHTKFLESSINDFIVRNQKFDTAKLLQETSKLFSNHGTSISMFDMLHNMRQIDDSTYAHSMNVALISRMIGGWVNFTKEQLDTLTLCGLLHDIGKSQIPESIIGKPGKLTLEEYDFIKTHAKLGYELLKNQPLDFHVKYSALMHHERYDGSGYPLGLSGTSIDDYASIISIADVYDAMTANRCYRSGLCPFEVIAVFEREGLNRYNPKYILTFLQRIADTYMNYDVLLNNGDQGEIVFINPTKLTRPMIKVNENEFINLENRLDLYIEAII